MITSTKKLGYNGIINKGFIAYTVISLSLLETEKIQKWTKRQLRR